MSIRLSQTTVNTKTISEEPKSASKVIFMRLPTSLVERVEHQKIRLSCSMNTLTRMALIKFLEEEESIERKTA